MYYENTQKHNTNTNSYIIAHLTFKIHYIDLVTMHLFVLQVENTKPHTKDLPWKRQ